MQGKKKAVCSAMCAAALAGALGMSGCYAMSDMHVEDKDGTATMRLIAGATQDEVNAALKPVLMGNGMTEAEADAWLADLPSNTAKVEGLAYGVNETTGVGNYSLSRDFGEIEVGPGKGIVADEDKFVVYDASALHLDELLSAPEVSEDLAPAEMADVAWRMLMANGVNVRVKVWLGDEVVPVATNMRKLSCCEAYGYGKDITAEEAEAAEDAVMSEPVFAHLTAESTTTSTVKPSVKSGSATRTSTVILDSPGVIGGVSINGTELGATDRVPLGKDGKKKIEVRLTNGNKATLSYTKDTAKPTANVKSGKSYKATKKGVKVTFKDSLSGVKTATLDGKKVKSGKRVTKKGTHKLVVTDKAGNALKVTFKVK